MPTTGKNWFWELCAVHPMATIFKYLAQSCTHISIIYAYCISLFLCLWVLRSSRCPFSGECTSSSVQSWPTHRPDVTIPEYIKRLLELPFHATRDPITLTTLPQVVVLRDVGWLEVAQWLQRHRSQGSNLQSSPWSSGPREQGQ